jgi:hypothetical protein
VLNLFNSSPQSDQSPLVPGHPLLNPAATSPLTAHQETSIWDRDSALNVIEFSALDDSQDENPSTPQ